nr:MFS transporter [Chromohalobacter sarecensis]
MLVLITLAGTLAMHIFVPSLPIAGEALHANNAQMQLTISLYILGLALGQLFYGPLSDALGRRPALMLGMLIYSVAGIVAWPEASRCWSSCSPAGHPSSPLRLRCCCSRWAWA